MTEKEKIADIKYLIMEHYSDKDSLTNNQKESKQCFLNYCDDIKNDLDRLDQFDNLMKKHKIDNIRELDKFLGWYFFKMSKKLVHGIKELENENKI